LKEFKKDKTVKKGKLNTFVKYGSWADRLCHGASKIRGDIQCPKAAKNGNCGKKAFGPDAKGKGAKYCPRNGKAKSYCNKEGKCVAESNDDDQKWKGYWVGEYCAGKCKKPAFEMHKNGKGYACGPKNGKTTCYFGLSTHWVCRRPGYCQPKADFDAQTKGKKGLKQYHKYGSWADALCQNNKK